MSIFTGREERVGWFGRYGVRECWLYEQQQRLLAVLSFANGRIARRVVFEGRDPIESEVLPAFNQTLRAFMRWEP